MKVPEQFKRCVARATKRPKGIKKYMELNKDIIHGLRYELDTDINDFFQENFEDIKEIVKIDDLLSERLSNDDNRVDGRIDFVPHI